jgi:hypothetical protein
MAGGDWMLDAGCWILDDEGGVGCENGSDGVWGGDRRLCDAMTRALLFILLFLPRFAVADGLPYLPNGELIGEWILLQMDDEQFREVDTRRTVTFTKPQRTMLGRLFKTVPEKATVVSSTHNDNREDSLEGEVHCVWLRDRVLGITYNADDAARRPEHYWDHAFFTSAAEPERLVISHDAKVYRNGRELKPADVYRLIDELGKTPPEKAGYLVLPGQPVAQLGFTLPPSNKDAVDLDTTPQSLLAAFAVYGESKKVQVCSTW